MLLHIDIISWITITYIFLIYFVVCPIILYSLHCFHSLKQDEIMQQFIANRPTHVIYLLNIIIVFTIGTERLFICITQIWSFTTNIPQWATYMFLSATWVTCMNLFAIKAYYFYYIKEYNKSISDTVWVATINSDNIENNWFIQNKNRFGNIYFLLKLNIIPSCISIL
eukprot:359577_1